MKKLLCLVLALMLALAAIGAVAEVTDLPRNEPCISQASSGAL